MPAHQPFTYLCQQLARGPQHRRADLHLHTIASDGLYTPAQVVELARRCGLAALAITDHDTFAGIGPARQAAEGSEVEVIAGVEITCEFEGRELHLLGYFIDLDYTPLVQALARIRQARTDRFAEMVERLRHLGVQVDTQGIDPKTTTLGRRHLAELLVSQGKVGSIREAFQRWLGEGSTICLPKRRLAVAEAIRLVREAGGVASWAHPRYDEDTHRQLTELASLGLGAVEVEYPDYSRSQKLTLRQLADACGLAISGGSDCHGPGKRALGVCTIEDRDLQRLRSLRGGICSAPCSRNSSKV